MQSLSKGLLEWFTDLQWERLLHQPSYVLLDLTREFYVGIPPKAKNTPKRNFSVIHGRLVSFSAERINEVLGLPNVEQSLEDMEVREKPSDMDRLLIVLCVPGTEWVKDKPTVFKVRRTSLKPAMKAISLWVMNSLLPTNHNLYWHKERLFLLECILGSKKINVGQLMEREILSCARRTIGSLLFPNLIRLLCEVEEVSRFDEEEEDYPLNCEINFSDEYFAGDKKEEEEKSMEEQKKGTEKGKEEAAAPSDKGQV